MISGKFLAEFLNWLWGGKWKKSASSQELGEGGGGAGGVEEELCNTPRGTALPPGSSPHPELPLCPSLWAKAGTG